VQRAGRGCSTPQRLGEEDPAICKKKPCPDSNPRPLALKSEVLTTKTQVLMLRKFAFSLLAVRARGSSSRGWSAVQAGGARRGSSGLPKCLSPSGGLRQWMGSYWSVLLLSVGGAALRSVAWPLARLGWDAVSSSPSREAFPMAPSGACPTLRLAPSPRCRLLQPGWSALPPPRPGVRLPTTREVRCRRRAACSRNGPT